MIEIKQNNKFEPLNVRLDSIDKVKNFCNDMLKCRFECDISENGSRHIVDAKSIMGIFSLNLTRNLTLLPTIDTLDDYEALKEIAAKYPAKQEGNE